MDQTQYGGRLTLRELALREFPWSVPEVMTQQSPYRRMRDHGEYVATKGEGMAPVKLSGFTRSTRNCATNVLEFDPHIPLQPGFADKGGFALRVRVDGDDDLLIRVHEYTNFMERRSIWRFPDTSP